jgi:hypothetical protein
MGEQGNIHKITRIRCGKKRTDTILTLKRIKRSNGQITLQQSLTDCLKPKNPDYKLEISSKPP